MIGDKAITLSLGLFPLALVTTPVGNLQLYWINLIFVALIPAVFSLMVMKNSNSGLKLWNILLLDGLLLIYVFVMCKWILNVF